MAIGFPTPLSPVGPVEHKTEVETLKTVHASSDDLRGNLQTYNNNKHNVIEYEPTFKQRIGRVLKKIYCKLG